MDLIFENKELRKEIRELKVRNKMLQYTVDRLYKAINIMSEAGIDEEEGID